MNAGVFKGATISVKADDARTVLSRRSLLHASLHRSGSWECIHVFIATW